MGPFERRIESLTEILSGSYEVKNLGWSGSGVEYSFTGEGNQEFIVEFEKKTPVSFLRMQKTDTHRAFLKALGIDLPKGFKPSQWNTFFQEPKYITEVSFRNNSPSVARGTRYTVTGTGKGDATRILGTVIQTIQDYVRKEKTEVLYFSAKEASRRKLYAHFARRFKSPLYSYFDVGDGLSVFVSKESMRRIKADQEVGKKKHKVRDDNYERWTLKSSSAGWEGYFLSGGERFAVLVDPATEWDYRNHTDFQALHLSGFDVPMPEISKNVHEIKVFYVGGMGAMKVTDPSGAFRLLDKFIKTVKFEGLYHTSEDQGFRTALAHYLVRRLPRFDIDDDSYDRVVALNPAFLAQYEVDGVMV